MKSYNFLITGVGGQGTVVASDILAAVGLAAGYDVKKSDVLGLAVRGGSVISHVRWADHVHSPIVPEGRVDVMIAFEFLEGLRWLDQMRPEGTILINRQRIFPVVVSAGLAEYPTLADTEAALMRAARHVYVVPGLGLAQELGNTRTLNVVLLGAFSGLVDVSSDIWMEVIRKRVPARVVEINLEAFGRGREVLSQSMLNRAAEASR